MESLWRERPIHVEAERFAADQVDMAVNLRLLAIVTEVGDGPVAVWAGLAPEFDRNLPHASQHLPAYP
ncbi:MAG: hypothetical protein J4G14_06640 [Dehalococcoidia bacterium]|nr:hypothetical protein [Dehalococcoidia bacterium]